MIEKNEGTNHSSARKRQNAANLQPTAQVLASTFNDKIEHARFLAR
jgi:hypothetical protein